MREQLRCNSHAESEGRPKISIVLSLRDLVTVVTVRWRAVTVLVLVIAAVHLHSWAVIELTSFDKPSNSSDNAAAEQVTFAPDGYCLRLGNGSSESQPFLHAILESSRQPDDWPSAAPDRLAVLPTHLHVASDDANNEVFVVTQALSCWCHHTRGELTWYMQGAQNVACLVVLETIKYAMALWGFFATVSLGMSAMFLPRSFTSCHAFSSFTSAMLGFLVTVAWWYYSTTYIDRDYLDELTLHWHHGVFYRCASLRSCDGDRTDRVRCYWSRRCSKVHAANSASG
ncbi:hypothetical protein PF011_g14203 [Phytophthora fragariae]|uniref:Transmembrane protein n=1 Tax=Phytophthora fragariae TaxID=53985 RepID=A0A6A3JZW3_9STRA|nr:hypothetical protein PF011_g14203 [Phytophthora fragariae]